MQRARGPSAHDEQVFQTAAMVRQTPHDGTNPYLHVINEIADLANRAWLHYSMNLGNIDLQNISCSDAFGRETPG